MRLSIGKEREAGVRGTPTAVALLNCCNATGRGRVKTRLREWRGGKEWIA